MYRRTPLYSLALFALVLFALSHLKPRAQPAAPTPGLTASERQRFYHLSMGSELMPLAWLRSLESAQTGKPFLEDVERFGLLPDPADPDGLPVGLSAADSRELRFAGKVVGLSCAACHVGELVYKGKRLRIDGGPGLFDADAFTRDLIESVVLTLKTPGRLLAFVKRVHSDPAHPRTLAAAWPGAAVHLAETVRLLKARVEFARKLLAESKRGLPATVAGPGRTDDFGLARNLIFEAKLAGPLTAPCSVSHVWGLDRVRWQDWDGNTTSAMGRSVATALAAGAVFDPTTYASTILPRNLAELDKLAARIRPPAWPEALFGKVDVMKAGRGAALFKQHCVRCHGEEELLFDPEEVGTDPARLRNYAAPLGNREFAGALRDTVAKYAERAYRDNGVSEQEAQKLEGGRPNQWRTTNKYVARSLMSVWATAPFLHNGSVPTLYDLLLPAAQRPKKFPLGQRDYDPKKLGYVTDMARPRFIFDTSLPGNSNAGHEYGTRLSDAERWALLEYLKSI